MSLFARISNYLTNDVAIDLGTANTLVFVRGNGIVLNGLKVHSAVLRDGDQVQLGDVVLSYREGV